MGTSFLFRGEQSVLPYASVVAGGGPKTPPESMVHEPEQAYFPARQSIALWTVSSDRQLRFSQIGGISEQVPVHMVLAGWAPSCVIMTHDVETKRGVTSARR